MNDTDEREALFASLFQVLDGLWFIEAEKEFGFDKALEIDKRVWRAFGQKEAQRLKKFMLDKKIITNNDSPLKVLEALLPESMFNKTLKFKIETSSKNDLVFLVSECKTLVGMKRIGRPEAQASAVCLDMGFTFYDAFAKAIDPAFQVTCLFTPFTKEKAAESNAACGWRFTLGKIG